VSKETGSESPAQEPDHPRIRIASILAAAAIAVAVIGYFVGITDGVPQPDGLPTDETLSHRSSGQVQDDPKVIPAIGYAEIPTAAMGPTDLLRTTSIKLPGIPEPELFAEIQPNAEEKAASARARASRRAFNGAPPVIPHAVADTNDAACYACHGGGIRIAGHKASVMSHPFLANCLQCHAPPPPSFHQREPEVESSFVGLPAPRSGQRAYPGAPPTIPHSRWMRQNCLACHGHQQGWAGMETTHPWRTNCTQCHAPSAALDQAIAADTIPMLPPLETAGREE